MSESNTQPKAPSKGFNRFLNTIERVGNKVPDPALLFLWAS